MKKIISLILIFALIFSLCACGKGSFVASTDLQGQIFEEFKNLSAVSRQTGATDRMTKYIIDTLGDMGIEAKADELGNVIADVPATSGMEKKSLTILQTNMDMKLTPYGTDADGYYDPLDVLNQNGMIMGDERSIGIDSGMMIATLFSFLRNGEEHGPLRLIFTVDKLDDFKGADGLDEGYFADAKSLINMSGSSLVKYYNASYGEKELLAWNINPKYRQATLPQEVQVTIYDVIGGSVDAEVAKGRINAADVMMSILLAARTSNIPFEISEIVAGYFADEIPEEAKIKMYIDPNEAAFLWNIFVDAVAPYKEKYGDTDPSLQIHMENIESVDEVIDSEQQDQILDYAKTINNGVISDSAFINLGMVDVNSKAIRFDTLIRSSNQDELEALLAEKIAQIEECGLIEEHIDLAPVWAADSNSELEKLVAKKYKKLFGIENIAKASLASHEASFFKDKNPDLEVISIGLDIYDSGTLEEFTNLETANKYYSLLGNVLKGVQ